MKENKYDDELFFQKYSEMDRSVKGLTAAGEWETLKNLLPDFRGKRMLDLGCGYGWHCRYAIEQGASAVTGVDISRKMLDAAAKKNADPRIEYLCAPMEDLDFPAEQFDIVLSSLAFHYVENFACLLKKIQMFLKPGGTFVFSVEHPVFTAYGSQDWYYDADGNILHFPVDRYYDEGKRVATFLGERVVKYHRTLTSYLNGLLENGFRIRSVVEPKPSEEMIRNVPGMQDELRRPMMLILCAEKT